MDEEMLTSDVWAKELEAVVIDPDGWDRRNFKFSWYEEKITRAEFDRRFSRSTADHSRYSPQRNHSL